MCLVFGAKCKPLSMISFVIYAQLERTDLSSVRSCGHAWRSCIFVKSVSVVRKFRIFQFHHHVRFCEISDANISFAKLGMFGKFAHSKPAIY